MTASQIGDQQADAGGRMSRCVQHLDFDVAHVEHLAIVQRRKGEHHHCPIRRMPFLLKNQELERPPLMVEGQVSIEFDLGQMNCWPIGLASASVRVPEMPAINAGKSRNIHDQKTEVDMKKRALITLAACLFLSTSVWSQPAGGGTDRAGYGPGMMSGYGPGMMGGYGPGMMGGYGGCGPRISNLTDEQQNKIAQIQKQFREKQWALMGQMQKDFAFDGIYSGGKIDEQASRKAYDAREKLHRQMFENSLEAQKRINAVLTPKQREQLQREWGGR